MYRHWYQKYLVQNSRLYKVILQCVYLSVFLSRIPLLYVCESVETIAGDRWYITSTPYDQHAWISEDSNHVDNNNGLPQMSQFSCFSEYFGPLHDRLWYVIERPTFVCDRPVSKQKAWHEYYNGTLRRIRPTHTLGWYWTSTTKPTTMNLKLFWATRWITGFPTFLYNGNSEITIGCS